MHFELARIDELSRSTGARTVLLEEDLSLYSPYELVPTREHLAQIRAQRDAVFGLFDLEQGEPLLVWLRPDEGIKASFSVEGDSLRFEGFARDPADDILGRAVGSTLIVQVDPPQLLKLGDGRSITSSFGASQYEDTIRHELTHVAAARLGVAGGTWLSEGLAHAVEWIPIDGDSLLRPDPPPERLCLAAALPKDRRSVARLLAWKHAYPPTDEDREARLLSFSFVAFALERQPAATFRERLLLLCHTEPATLRSLEAEWSAWLDQVTGECRPGP
jgi:hypothetical protein